MNKYESTVNIQYKLMDLYDALDEYAKENNGEVNEEIDAEIIELESMLEDRAAYYVETIVTLQDSVKGGEERLKAMKASIDKKKKRIEDLTEKLVAYKGRDKVVTDKFAMSWKKNTPSVKIDESIELALKNGEIKESIKQYVTEKTVTTYSLPKKALKEAIDNGEEIEGVWLESSYSMKVE